MDIGNLCEIALRYKTRMEFKKNSPGVYKKACKLGILNDICQHIPRKPKRLKWNFESIRKEALKYSKRSDFQKNSRNAYNAAMKYGMLDSVSSHMGDKINEKWTLEELKEEALKYKSRSEFNKFSKTGYQAARIWGILDDICQHMPKNLSIKWSDEELLSISSKFNSRSELASQNQRAYSSIIGRGISEKAFSHMPNPRIIWDYGSIQEVALKCNSKKEFRKKFDVAYQAAIKLDIIDKICSHMKKSYDKSDSELEVLLLVRNHFPESNTLRVRKINILDKPHIKGFDIDVFIPELNKGIEFDGTYWHSVKGLSRSRQDWPKEDLENYHNIKNEYFRSKGIEILHISEKEWISNRKQSLSKIIDFIKVN